MLKIKLILVLVLSSPLITSADADQDKKAGTCAMFLYFSEVGHFGNYKATSNEALNLSDRPIRAAQYGKLYADKIKAAQARKESTKALLESGMYNCYDIGLRLK